MIGAGPAGLAVRRFAGSLGSTPGYATGSMNVPRFSVVVPAYNEAGYLPRLLDTLNVARVRYRGGADAIEVIVADNASTDGTADIARHRGCRVVRVEKRVIAAARNGGARAARGEVLAFVDADFQVHPETFNAIDDVLGTGRVVAGATGVEPERLSLGLAVTFVLMMPLVWTTGMDTGLVFCRREDFEAIGGYNERRLFAEDVQFLWDLKRLGRARRQKLARVTSVKAVASMRKFDEYGEWHYLTTLVRGLFWMVFSPGSLDAWVRGYWYRERS